MHGGAGSSFEFSHRSSAGASLRGRRQSSCLKERVAAIPVVYLNTLIFRGNARLQAKRSRGFHPRRCGSPDAITPGQVLRHHRSAQGRHGGTGTVPSFIRTSILEFHTKRKGILRSLKPGTIRKKRSVSTSFPSPLCA
jgi:hypothetical protein